ncbi:MAG: hypothetical protein LBT40_18195 [Deltaproteobacteria bacterium]|jgi:hypothetical protein|nr:hypothetical protein [Deltaproteobacteria bacterium]
MKTSALLAIAAFALPVTFVGFLCLASSAGAQPDDLVVFADSGQRAIYCSYEENETGSYPDIVYVNTSKGNFILDVLFPELKDYDLFKTLKPGTPIDFSYSVLYAYDESGEGMMTYTGVTEINPTGVVRDTNDCQNFNRREGVIYSVDKAAGHFCGFKSGTDVTPDTVSIKTSNGVFSVIPKMDRLEKMKALSELALGTPLTFDMKIEDSDKSNDSRNRLPPIVTLSRFEASGEPVDGACPATAQ